MTSGRTKKGRLFIDKDEYSRINLLLRHQAMPQSSPPGRGDRHVAAMIHDPTMIVEADAHRAMTACPELVIARLGRENKSAHGIDIDHASLESIIVAGWRAQQFLNLCFRHAGTNAFE
jgi:hypothetical protein